MANSSRKSDRFDVIVIGGGVMGSSTAYHAAKLGQKTLLIEQFDFLHHRGSSHGESRTIRTTYPEPYYRRMAIESEKLWIEAESEIGYEVYSRSKQLDIGPKNNRSLMAVIENCEKQSVNHRILDRYQTDEHFSGRIELPDDWIAVVTDVGGVLKPTKSVAMFQTLAIKYGAVLRDKTEIVDVVRNGDDRGGVSVTSRSGEVFSGKKCVVTAGAWVSKLVEKVSNGGYRFADTAVGNICIKESHEVDFAIGAGFPSFASYGEPVIYGTPASEFPDMIKVCVHGGRDCDPDKRTWGTDSEDRFGDRVDWEDGPVISQSCLYSMTPDEDYIIDFLGGGFNEDVVVAGGFSGHGFKMAPLVGKILVDLAVGGKAAAGKYEEEIKHFKVGRFEGNPKGNKKGFEEQGEFKCKFAIRFSSEVSQVYNLTLDIIINSSVERAFSAMKLIKTSTQNKMGDQFLSDYFVSYTKKVILEGISNDTIMQIFKGIRPCRVQFSTVGNIPYGGSGWYPCLLGFDSRREQEATPQFMGRPSGRGYGRRFMVPRD
ncbi:hypothetical protein OSB04_023073 [Centaurea solstitialis]|uniref:FAD dependent oxidoreductase domain-containing protein n=1 Tax=Centaurea solstitialis TaxID=347529 RepID=A0AA38WCJ5_9ASTR|nr:hypothetical protein OSB04_023073 [Centaurea solstitialis]